jgi:inosine/xanthosine triphosphate pyrophosphatase family protein
MSDLPAEEQAAQAREAAEAMLEALKKTVTADDATIYLVALGGLVGSICASTENPDRALASINAVARDILDGMAST